MTKTFFILAGIFMMVLASIHNMHYHQVEAVNSPLAVVCLFAGLFISLTAIVSEGR